MSRLTRIRVAPIACLLLAALPLAADEPVAEPVDSEPPPIELPADVAVAFDAELEAIREEQALIIELKARVEQEDSPLMRSVYEARMDAVWTDMFRNALSLARKVAARREAGFDVSALQAALTGDLEVFPEEAVNAIERISAEIRYPADAEEPADLVLRDQELLAAVRRYDAVLASLVTYTQIAESMQLDDAEQVDYLLRVLPDGAANRSAYLDLSISQVGVARAAAATLPQNASLADRVRAAEARVKTASAILQEIVRLMDAMGLDTRRYRQQLVSATGEVTTDVLDVGVATGLIVEWTDKMYTLVQTEGPRFVFSLLLFALIVFVAARLGRIARRLAGRGLDSSRFPVSNLLKRMIVSSIGNVILLIGILVALSQLGISLGPLLAGLGIAGFIVGFALQDTLSNFASGMMILMYRPFDVGDFVTAGGVTGRVDRMSLVNTTFTTLDNQVMVVPNNLIWQSVITNVTAQTTRRVDLTFGIAYSDDFATAERVLWEILDGYDKILPEPKPLVRLHELGESSVNIIVRPWVKTEDYWETYWDLTRAVKERFDAEGITIPFPQRDVHMVPAE